MTTHRLCNCCDARLQPRNKTDYCSLCRRGCCDRCRQIHPCICCGRALRFAGRHYCHKCREGKCPTCKGSAAVANDVADLQRTPAQLDALAVLAKAKLPLFPTRRASR